MQTDINIDIHEREDSYTTPTVRFRQTAFDVGLPHEWGVLAVEIRHPDHSKIEYKYFMHGPSWQAKAARIRTAFRRPVNFHTSVA